ncbi:hypothetical protein CMV_025193, partial [Castanea mollissima]
QSQTSGVRYNLCCYLYQLVLVGSNFSINQDGSLTI